MIALVGAPGRCFPISAPVPIAHGVRDPCLGVLGSIPIRGPIQPCRDTIKNSHNQGEEELRRRSLFRIVHALSARGNRKNFIDEIEKKRYE